MPPPIVHPYIPVVGPQEVATQEGDEHRRRLYGAGEDEGHSIVASWNDN